MPEAEGGAELLSLSEIARRVVAEGIEDRMSHQRVSQLSREDPAFPPIVMVGRSKAVDWRLAGPYFKKRVKRQGKRTDLPGNQQGAPAVIEGQMGTDPLTGNDARALLRIVWKWIEDANDGVGGDVGDLMHKLETAGYGPVEEG